MIEYADASPQVRAVYDDIKQTRNVPDVNNFWKYLARDPATLKRTWESVKQVMAPGALDPLWPVLEMYPTERREKLAIFRRQGADSSGTVFSTVPRKYGAARGDWLPSHSGSV